MPDNPDFGDFEIEVRGFDAGFARGAIHVLGQAFGGEILARDVHRHA